MNEFILSEQEQKTLTALIEDWGFDYALQAKTEEVVALARRLGMTEYVERYQ